MKDDVFAVIADPTRRHILESLAVEKLAVGELVEELGVSQPTVSKHLKVLRTAGLVETEAVGQKRFYSIVPQPLEKVTSWVASLSSPSASFLPAAASVAPLLTTSDAAAQPADAAKEAEPAEGALLLEPAQTVETAQADEPGDAEPSTEDREEPLSAPAEADTSQAEAEAEAEAEQQAVSAITFTPLTPFTPEPLAPPAQQSAAAEPEPAETAETPETFEAPEPGEAPESGRAESDAEGETEAPLYAEDPLAQEQSDDEDRGLLAKLTRWGRRNAR